MKNAEKLQGRVLFMPAVYNSRNPKQRQVSEDRHSGSMLTCSKLEIEVLATKIEGD